MQVHVKARKGLKVPMERMPRRHIGEQPQRITLSPYYRRMLREGDLVQVGTPRVPRRSTSSTPDRSDS